MHIFAIKKQDKYNGAIDWCEIAAFHNSRGRLSRIMPHAHIHTIAYMQANKTGKLCDTITHTGAHTYQICAQISHLTTVHSITISFISFNCSHCLSLNWLDAMKLPKLAYGHV